MIDEVAMHSRRLFLARNIAHTFHIGRELNSELVLLDLAISPSRAIIDFRSCLRPREGENLRAANLSDSVHQVFGNPESLQPAFYFSPSKNAR